MPLRVLDGLYLRRRVLAFVGLCDQEMVEATNTDYRDYSLTHAEICVRKSVFLLQLAEKYLVKRIRVPRFLQRESIAIDLPGNRRTEEMPLLIAVLRAALGAGVAKIWMLKYRGKHNDVDRHEIGQMFFKAGLKFVLDFTSGYWQLRCSGDTLSEEAKKNWYNLWLQDRPISQIMIMAQPWFASKLTVVPGRYGEKVNMGGECLISIECFGFMCKRWSRGLHERERREARGGISLEPQEQIAALNRQLATLKRRLAENTTSGRGSGSSLEPQAPTEHIAKRSRPTCTRNVYLEEPAAPGRRVGDARHRGVDLERVQYLVTLQNSLIEK